MKNPIKMSKAEDRALEQYPVEMYEDVGWRCVDKNEYKRQYFIEGYNQAEKDLKIVREEIYYWLANHYRDYMYNPTGKKLEAFFGMDMITDLKQAMNYE